MRKLHQLALWAAGMLLPMSVSASGFEQLLGGRGIWIDRPGNAQESNPEALRELGVRRVHLMISAPLPRDSECKKTATLPILIDKQAVIFDRLTSLKSSEFVTLATLYVSPRKDFIEKLTEKDGFVSKLITSGAAGIEYDLEGDFTGSAPCGFASHADAVRLLVERTKSLSSAPIPVGWTTNPGHLIDSRIPADAFDFFSPQAYGARREPTYLWDSNTGPGRQQRYTMEKLKSNPTLIILGLGAYKQKYPDHTVDEAMEKSHSTMLDLVRENPKIIGHSYWSASFVRKGASDIEKLQARAFLVRTASAVPEASPVSAASLQEKKPAEAPAAAPALTAADPNSVKNCDMAELFTHLDERGTTNRSIWADSGRQAYLFVDHLNVNTDGTRRSYRVDDFWGTALPPAPAALNNLCNAMSDNCEGLSKAELRERRIATEQAAAHSWPVKELAATKIGSNMIAFKNGKPCTSADNYLVSATALRKPKITDECDQTNYIDSLTVPAVVIPGSKSWAKNSNVKVGDLAVAMIPGSMSPVYAVVGDSGPADSIGEASLALNGLLLGKKKEPVNYQEVLGREPFVGQSWVVPQAIVIFFPGTRDVSNPFITSDRIKEKAEPIFRSWGGAARLAACGREYH